MMAGTSGRIQVGNYGDWQLGIYLGGLDGDKPSLPMSFAELERRAEAAMSPEIWSSVAGGAGNEHTQDATVPAFERWGLSPRLLRCPPQRDVTVPRFGPRFPPPPPP